MSTTTWIIIIVIVIIIIIAIGIAVYFLVFRKNPTSPTDPITPTNPSGNIPSNAIKYGDTVSIFNTSTDFGGYAYLCGTVSGGSINVAIRTEPFKQWKIVDTSLNSTGGPIQYGQEFKLQTVEGSENRYLGYCGATIVQCGTNVCGKLLPQERTTTWTFKKLSTSSDNDYVIPNTNLEILNTDMDKNNLSVCGTTENCGFNVTNFNEQIQRLNNLSLKTWQLR